MSDRIYIGPSGSEMLFRISPPGQNAGDISGPAVFSSTGNYLKVHHVLDSVLNRTNDFHWGAFTFPTLGFIPMAFVSITHTSLDRVFFPNDRNPATSEMNNFWRWGIQDGKAWVYTDTANNFGGNYRFRCLIFNNRATEYTPA